MKFDYKAEVQGKGGIVVRVVADSVSPEGKRIVTFEGEVHRSIWSEFMTHRLFSRNAMSSRAVPIHKMIENTKAVPIKFGKKKAGMVSGEEHNESVFLIDGFGTEVEFSRDDAWEEWAESNRKFAHAFDRAGYHKGDINRPLEAFQYMKFVMTSTELDNFFWLRRDEDAKEEIKELADCIHKSLEISEPSLLKPGEWHLPYVNISRVGNKLEMYTNGESGEKVTLSLDKALAISASCCGQVSYRNINNCYEKALDIYDKLGVTGGGKLHASPFEHQASPMEEADAVTLGKLQPITWEEGITHMDSYNNFWSGNFKGWVQHRQLLDGHSCWLYEEDA